MSAEITMTLTADEARGVLRAREEARHDVRLTSRHHSQGAAYRGVCKCGWVGPDRAMNDRGHRTASDDGTAHVRDTMRGWDAA